MAIPLASPSIFLRETAPSLSISCGRSTPSALSRRSWMWTRPHKRRSSIASMSFSPRKIISGGQAGVDRAALDFAVNRGIPYGGFVPKGRWAEDGRISDKYQSLIETRSTDPAERTRSNVLSADAVLVISRGTPDGGTRLTIALAKQLARPLIVVDLGQASLFQDDLPRQCAEFMRDRETMIAGPRETKC